MTSSRAFHIIKSRGCFRSSVALAALLVSPGIATSASAQANDAAAPDASPGSDIVVTANRRSESVQRVASAVTVVSPEELTSKGLGSLGDVTSAAPAVFFQQLSPGVNRIDMRGITTGSIDVNVTQDRPLVAVYLDDIPLALQSGNPDLRVFDLERIEVVRGPQGTLYGAGSMAGTIRYITAKPSTDRIMGSVESTGSLTQDGSPSYSLRGLLNVPLTDDLAVRIGGYTGRDGGYIDNLGTGRDDANYAFSTQARVAVRYKPLDRLTLDASYTFAHLRTGGTNAVYRSLPGKYTFTSSTPEGFEDDLNIYNLTGTYGFDFADLVSSSSYVSRSNTYREDYGFAGGLFGLPPFEGTNSATTNRLRDFSQEVRLVSNDRGPLSYTVGAFYQRTRRNNDQDIPSPGFDAAFSGVIGAPYTSLSDQANSNDDIFSGFQRIRERQFAVFGEAKLTLGRLDLTGGLRYFNFKQDFSSFNAGIAGVASPGVPNEGSGTAKADGFNPRAVAAFRVVPDLMIYAEAARGFRYGGLSPAVPSSVCELSQGATSFGPDSLWSYTVGEKAQFFDRRVTLNVSAFLIKWKDVQTTRLLRCGYTVTENAGKIESKGIELESSVRATDALRLTLNASYTDAGADGAIINVGAVDGDRVPFFPRYTVAASADYTVQVSDGELVFSGDLQQRGASYTQFSPTNARRRELPAATLVNLSVRYDLGEWEFGLFGTNLTNSGNVSLVRPPAGSQIDDKTFYGRPRTVGLRVKRNF